MQRRTFLGGTALALAAMACGAPSSAASTVHATALTEVFGDGLKLTAVAVQYDRDIDTAALDTASFAVADRTVTRVYANTVAAVADSGRTGPYVIIELTPVPLWTAAQGGGPPAAGHASAVAPVITPAAAVVTQVAALRAADGSMLPPGTVTTTDVVTPIVDDFVQRQFHDPATGVVLNYNLLVPPGYDPAKRYPLVLFMHDASVVGAPVIGPLVQGRGAIAWAGHDCFVVAPQYDTVVVDDNYRPTPAFDATVNLVRALTGEYSIGSAHATGQSMGAMMTLGLNIKYPDVFASSYVVAGQWPVEQSAPLARKRLWYTVSQGDAKAYSGADAITALAERDGARVARAVWSAQSDPAQFDVDVAALVAQGADINYVAFALGSTLDGTPSGGAAEHMGTWRYAYDIPGILDWVLGQ